MSESPQPSPKNVIDMMRRRRSQRTLNGGSAFNGRGPGAKKYGKPGGVGPGTKIWHYVQFVIVLGLLAMLMQICRGGL